MDGIPHAFYGLRTVNSCSRSVYHMNLPSHRIEQVEKTIQSCYYHFAFSVQALSASFMCRLHPRKGKYNQSILYQSLADPFFVLFLVRYYTTLRWLKIWSINNVPNIKRYILIPRDPINDFTVLTGYSFCPKELLVEMRWWYRHCLERKQEKLC